MPAKHDYLKRLPPENYRGRAFVHWSMTMEDRQTGWLIPIFYYKFREILTHAAFRYGFSCPIYCCMPDHLHLLWVGILETCDQRVAARYFRRQLNPALEKLGARFQRQPYDHVLRESERDRGAFETVAEYIARNPERAGLVKADGYREYPYTGRASKVWSTLSIWKGSLALSPVGSRSSSGMLLDPAFQPFLEQRPVCVMARAVLRRIPDPGHSDALFERTARRQSTHELLFSALVGLMSQVVPGVQPSVHASHRALEDRLPVSDQAVYDKLQHVELAVARELVRDSARRVAPLVRKLRAGLPSWLPGYRAKILDGNHLGSTGHRLPEPRATWAAPLPGKGLVVLDQATMTVLDVLPAEDGRAQERSLPPEVIPLVERGDLWLGGRNFCTIPFLFALAGRGAAFVLRRHGTVKGELLGRRRARGRCATGRVYEQRLRLRDGRGQVREFRRVTVELDRPTKGGDTETHLPTNLPARKASAGQVAELYRRRWAIEGLFPEVAQTPECEIDTLCYPKAALFAFGLGLLAANAAALLKAALRAAHGRRVAQEQLSGYHLALEIRQTYAGMMVAIPAEPWAVFNRLGDAEPAETLREMAGRVKLARYRKSPRGPKNKPPAKSRYQNGAQVATAKILAARKAKE